jgi:hypothetical protein
LTISESTNGGTSSYTYNFVVYNSIGSVVLAQSSVNSLDTNSFTFDTSDIGLGNSFTTNVEVVDNASTPVTINSLTVGFNVIEGPLAVSFSASPNPASSGTPETLTATASGGTPPYTYDFYNVGTGVNIVGCPISSNSMCSFTAFTNQASSSFNYNVIVTDSLSATANAVNVTLVVVNSSVTTTTISNGGGGGGGASTGGGFGPLGPTITPFGSSCYTAAPVAALDSFDIHFGRTTIHVIDNFITPNETGVTANGQSYTLLENQSQGINGTNATIELTVISYLPIEHTVTLELCSVSGASAQVPPATGATAKSIVLNLTYNASTLEIINATPQGIAMLSNGTGTPPLPNNVRDISVANITVSTEDVSMDVIGINAHAEFDCSLGTGITPYILNRSTNLWVPISPFRITTGAICLASFALPPDSVVALLQSANPVAPLKPLANTTTIAAATSVAPSNMLWWIVLAIVIIAILAFLFLFAGKKRKKKRQG